jgi:hypothetical protein
LGPKEGRDGEGRDRRGHAEPTEGGDGVDGGVAREEGVATRTRS